MRENEQYLKSIDIFSPGRICLFGEHSDWVGCYDSANPITYAIASSIPLGIEARVTADKYICEDNIIIRYEDSKYDRKSFSLNDKDGLINTIECNYEDMYIAGTLLEMVSRYDKLDGCYIFIKKQSLPIKKGLSSSAAICCLIIKALAYANKLDLDNDTIADIAYCGERRTLSKCGRLDQVVAFPQGIRKITFDKGNAKYSSPILHRFNPLKILLIDIVKEKDRNTVSILKSLNDAIQYNIEPISDKLTFLFTRFNNAIVESAIEYFAENRYESLGSLMTTYQKEYTHIMEECGFTECIDHNINCILNNSEIYDYIYGGKGIGAHGDGSCILLCKSDEDRVKAINLLKNICDFEYNYTSIDL